MRQNQRVTKLTKTYIDKLPIPDMKNGKHTQKFYRDTTLTGFAIRVSSTGKKTFVVDKKTSKQHYRIVLGQYGQLTPDSARKQAEKRLGELATGVDPRDEKRREELASISFEEALEGYLTANKSMKDKTRRDYRAMMNRDLSDWKAKPITSIREEDITKRHTKIHKRTPYGADNCMKMVQGVFTYMIPSYRNSKGESFIKRNPVGILTETKSWHRKVRRKTYVKINQLPIWHKAVMSLTNDRKTSIATVVRDYVIAVLFTGNRKDELRTITYSKNIDFGSKIINLYDTKNHLDFTLPMSDFLYRHFKKLHENSTCDFVFPNVENTAPIVNPYKVIARITRITEEITEGKQSIKFTLHDLRRTFTTTAESLELSAYAVKRLLNHSTGSDVTAGYIMQDSERLRESMQRISRCLLSAINGEFTSYQDY